MTNPGDPTDNPLGRAAVLTHLSLIALVLLVTVVLLRKINRRIADAEKAIG